MRNSPEIANLFILLIARIRMFGIFISGRIRTEFLPVFCFEHIRKSNTIYRRDKLLSGYYPAKFLAITILLFSGIFSTRAQDTTQVSGIILSDSKQPLANVSISVEGSSQMPVVTDETGEFTIVSTSTSDWIIISPTDDYKTKRVFLNGRKNLKIYLTSNDLSSGDDQIKILSQNISRRNMITAYTSLNTGDIQHTSAVSVDQHMQGRVPGMNVVNSSGMPASGAMVNLRGVNSINASNQPLYVVDGIPLMSQGVFNSNLDGFEYNPLLGVNPFDISATTVVKDPSITAAYGSKGSNGIVFIETLDPSITQTTIDVDFRAGYSLSPKEQIPQLNAGQHKTLMSEVLYSSGYYEETLQKRYPSLYLTPEDEGYINYQHNTNWQSLIFEDAYMTNMNIDVKGGDEIARYGLSFGYLDSKAIIKDAGYQGYNLRFVSRLNIFTWLKMNAGVSLNRSSSTLKEAATVSQTSPILTSLAKSPLLNPYQYDIDGNEIKTLAEVDDIGVSNPLATIQNYNAQNFNNNFISTVDFEGRINRVLTAVTKFSLSYNLLKEQIFMPNHGMEHYYNMEAINVSKSTSNDLRAFFNNTYVSYKKSFGNNHQVSSGTGLNLQTNKFQLDWGLTKNAHPSDQYTAIQDGQPNLREIGGDNRSWNWISFYENFSYSFKDKYLVTGSLSLDGSSRVGDSAVNTVNIGNTPFGFFYSGGVAWRISSESIMKNWSWLDDLKLRASIGKTGNDDIGESSATNYYQAIKFRETLGLFPALLPNDKLTYETVNQLNTGLDLSVLGNRLAFSFDLFKSKTDNMLIFSPVEAYFGYDLRIENSGKMENKGIEFNTYMRLIDMNSFKWDISANLSKISNEVTEIKGGSMVTSIQGAEIINTIGETANSFYGYIFKGVYSTKEEAIEASLVNNRGIPYLAGDAIYEDISGPGGVPDGVINNYDKTTIGSAMPDFFGGLTNSFTYKRITLSATIQFVSGNELFNYVRYKNESMTGLENQSSTVLNRWQFDGQVTDIPRALWEDPIGNSTFSTRWIEDGTYLRLKNISLSYLIPDKVLVFRNAEFYVSANNIFTSTKYLGYDPEFSYSFSQIHQGVDYGQCPQARQFIFGLKFGL
jgi:TonB-linked SusC/RagA family outer membrane protein